MDDLKKKYEGFAESGGPLHGIFAVYDVRTINHKPHPFCIGPGHVAYASDRCGSILSPEAVRASGIGCAMANIGPHGGKCNLPFDAHTSDFVLCLKMLRNATNMEASRALFAIREELTKDKFDGIVFIETPERFRIEAPIKDDE